MASAPAAAERPAQTVAPPPAAAEPPARRPLLPRERLTQVLAQPLAEPLAEPLAWLPSIAEVAPPTTQTSVPAISVPLPPLLEEAGAAAVAVGDGPPLPALPLDTVPPVP